MRETNAEYLGRNSFFYERCLPWVRSLANDSERCLEAMEQTAFIAWLHHPGRFADGALENIALRIGRGPLPGGISVPRKRFNSPVTLHIATELYNVGGHTRVLAKWVARDPSSSHLVVLTRQSRPVPDFFQQAIASVGGQLTVLPRNEPFLARAAAVRELARDAQRVILHTNPDDPVPVVAFAEPSGPPVAMFNHAHFSFGFGPSVSDLIANTTEAFRDLSAKYRFARRTARLIGVAGLAPMHRQPVDKRAAKAGLGLSPDAPTVLSIGNEAYYSPANGYDFFRTAEKLLAASPDVTLIVVGVRQVSPLVPDGLRAHPRCRWAGPVLDPVPYYEAADLCLESFPMPSLGAVGEAVVYGEAFPIPVYGKGENFLRVSQAPVLDYSFRPADEAEYVAYITELLAQLPIRRAEAHDLRLAMVELDDRWSDELASFNRTVDACRHAPAEIPVCPCLAIEECEVIAGLSAIDLGARIDTVLPFGIAVRAHVDAVRAGLSRPRALGRVGRLAWQGVQRKVAQSTRMGGSVDW